jgi:DDE superfamily endonuclease
METQWLPTLLVVWITTLAGMLDARQQARFVQLCTGLLFARGRRTVTSWLRACGVGRDYKRYYYLLGSVGRKATAIAGAVLRILFQRLPADPGGTPLVFALDDSPTKRYGPHVEGAGTHHNPTPGPAGSKFLYGHVWVCLARLVRHPHWGTIALPILSHLYIRAKDIGWMAAYYGWQFRTKLELAAAQVEWLVQQLGTNHPPIWVVTDGAYAKRPFLKPVLAAGVTVISRLRCNAALWSLPAVVTPGQKKGPGRPPKYGKKRIDLAKRAAQTGGWRSGLFSVYGRLEVKKYNTFLATYAPVGGVIRVVLVREPERWVAYFATDPGLSAASILEAVADRGALEQVFHDVKEVHGAGQQQLRHVWANVGAWNLISWWYTLVELWAWDRPQSRLCDRSDSPWDKAERRPSHANRCRELRREALEEEFSSLPSLGALRPKIRRFIQRLMRRVA